MDVSTVTNNCQEKNGINRWGTIVEKIDASELDHLVAIRAHHRFCATQLAAFQERVKTFEGELHDMAVMERGHLAFLSRKYGADARLAEDGTITRPEIVPPPEPLTEMTVVQPGIDPPVDTSSSDPIPVIDPATVAVPTDSMDGVKDLAYHPA